MEPMTCLTCKHRVALGFDVMIGGPNIYQAHSVLKCNCRPREIEEEDPSPIVAFMIDSNPGCDMYEGYKEKEIGA